MLLVDLGPAYMAGLFGIGLALWFQYQLLWACYSHSGGVVIILAIGGSLWLLDTKLFSSSNLDV